MLSGRQRTGVARDARRANSEHRIGHRGLQAELKSSKELLEVPAKVWRRWTLCSLVFRRRSCNGRPFWEDWRASINWQRTRWQNIAGRATAERTRAAGRSVRGGAGGHVTRGRGARGEDGRTAAGVLRVPGTKGAALGAEAYWSANRSLRSTRLPPRAEASKQMLQANDSASATAVAPIELPPRGALQEQLQELGVRWSAVKTRKRAILAHPATALARVDVKRQTGRAAALASGHRGARRADSPYCYTDFTRIGPLTEDCSARCMAHSSLCKVLDCSTTYLFTIVVKCYSLNTNLNIWNSSCL